MSLAAQITALASRIATQFKTAHALRNVGDAVITHTGPTVTIDMTAGSQHKVTASGATTITVDPGPGDEERTGYVKVFNPAGDTVTWVGASGVTLSFPNKTMPDAPAAGENDRYTIHKENSTTADLLPGHTNMGPVV